ncbi:MAG: tyrosine-type recombinase/integrase [Bacteroidaceae bacterium]|nr:tyrosine-type recombinase/integrase [Bacteroidaceae bacterium]
MANTLNNAQIRLLRRVMAEELEKLNIQPRETALPTEREANEKLLAAFVAAKRIEGCSAKTLHYYEQVANWLLAYLDKRLAETSTTDIRNFLADYQNRHGVGRVTVDNLRRILSSFFGWLEDEDFIPKNPVRRIHKVRTEKQVREVISDEQLERLRDSCTELRDVALIDLLASTGMRVGELVKLNRSDIDFHERQCVVFGKGDKERQVYFNARTKIHLLRYLDQRTDVCPALFVTLAHPHSRLSISAIELRLRQLGRRANIGKVHPHKFRRTMATMAIDKGMPIEQVQRLLGHTKIDTTLHYAMVSQNNVKLSHRKFIS